MTRKKFIKKLIADGFSRNRAVEISELARTVSNYHDFYEYLTNEDIR